MTLISSIVSALLLSRLPFLNNHTLNWVALLAFSWLIADKLQIPTRKKLFNLALRVTTALMALVFLAGLGEVTFDPFWIIKSHMTLNVYLNNVLYASFFYTGFIFGLAFFQLRRLWALALPLSVTSVWFMVGLHMPAGLYPGDLTYYYDYIANFFDIAQQIAAFIAGYIMISGLRLLPMLNSKPKLEIVP